MARGGELVVDVGDTPNTSWGTEKLPVDHVRPATGPVPNLPAACTASGPWCAQDLGGQYDACADGGVTETDLSITDWAAPAARHGERPAVTATTRYRTDGTADGRTARIRRRTVPLDASREATSLVLSANANAEVFALSAGAP